MEGKMINLPREIPLETLIALRCTYRNLQGDNMKRDTPRYDDEFKFLLTKAQKEKLFFQAELAGITSSEFLRRKVSEQNISSKIEMTLINELRRQGGLIKNNFQTIRNSALAYDEKEQLTTQMKKSLNDMQNLISDISSSYKG